MIFPILETTVQAGCLFSASLSSSPVHAAIILVTIRVRCQLHCRLTTAMQAANCTASCQLQCKLPIALQAANCTASCQLYCKLPIAMQTDECRRQYEDFSLDEHAAVDNAMHCDAIFNEQYAKCSPYSKMQRALKSKFTQCKP